MINTTSALIAAAPGPYARMRTGVIVSFTTNQAQVTIGTTTFAASYLRGAQLAVGDLVAALYQDGTWLILGAYAGVGPNLLGSANFSFEDSAPGTFPVQWFQADLSGVSVIVVTDDSTTPGGSQVASVSGPAVGTQSYLYSQPIPVTTGDQFTVSAYAGADYQPGDTPTADAAIVALWFANATNLYPTTSAVDTVITSVTDLAQAPPYTTLGGTVTAPVTGFMRIALRSTVEASQVIRWDTVIVREA